jgi:two-component system phosphate regulon sensor histidine kinase PhoR
MPRAAELLRPRSLTGRLVLWHAVAILSVLLVLGLVLDRVLEGYLVGQLTDALISDARAIEQVVPAAGDLESEVTQLGGAMGVRITIIRTDGEVLADSEHDPATMENHGSRPEVIEALHGDIGKVSRQSATIGIAFRYVALPPKDGRIVRVALPLTTVQSRLRAVRLILAIGFAAAAVAGLLALLFIGGRLSRPIRRITSSVEALGMGNESSGASIPVEGTEEVALLARTVNRMRDEVAARVRSLEAERAARDAILGSLEEGVALFDGAGSVIYQNERAGSLLGRAIESAERLAPVGLRRLVADAEAGNATDEVEVVAGPAARTLRATAVPLPGGGRVLLMLRDVTQARLTDAVRRDFVANASHELKTPAASIRALAETIASTAADDPQAMHRFAGQLELEAVRLSRIISDLLDLSRLEGAPGTRNEIRLDRLVEDEAARFRSRAEEANLSLSVQCDEPALIPGSAQDLALLVRNLIQNAIQYTRPGGHIDVRVSTLRRAAVLTVRDTGIGIPTKDRARIFERFYRVDRARSRETGGTGLGLSIVKHVAENHGGAVSVESELGQGSTFIVRLPLSR